MYNEVIDSFTGLKWNVAAILDLCQLRSKPAGRFWPNSSIMMMDIYIYIYLNEHNFIDFFCNLQLLPFSDLLAPPIFITCIMGTEDGIS